VGDFVKSRKIARPFTCNFVCNLNIDLGEVFETFLLSVWGRKRFLKY
jgi:hypothetical protein